MARIIASVVIMVISAFAGMYLGSAINGAEAFTNLFAMIAGFACTIHAIETKKERMITSDLSVRNALRGKSEIFPLT